MFSLYRQNTTIINQLKKARSPPRDIAALLMNTHIIILLHMLHIRPTAFCSRVFLRSFQKFF